MANRIVPGFGLTSGTDNGNGKILPGTALITEKPAAAPAGGRIMSSLANHGGLAGLGGIAGKGGGLAA